MLEFQQQVQPSTWPERVASRLRRPLALCFLTTLYGRPEGRMAGIETNHPHPLCSPFPDRGSLDATEVAGSTGVENSGLQLQIITPHLSKPIGSLTAIAGTIIQT